MRYTIIIYMALLINIPVCSGQVSPANQKKESTALDESLDLQTQLVPLDSIVDLAIKNSPAVKFQKDLIESSKAQLEFSKRVWTNNIMGFVNYSTGNQSIVSSDNLSAGSVASSNITSGFRMGVQINLPLYELVGRKSRVNLYKYQYSSSINKRDESIQELKKEVISTYYNLLYSSNLLSIRSEAKESAINQYNIAQKQFKDGAIDVLELSRIKTIEVNARADYEDAKRQFSTLYAQMEPLVGVPVNQLIVRK